MYRYQPPVPAMLGRGCEEQRAGASMWGDPTELETPQSWAKATLYTICPAWHPGGSRKAVCGYK